MIRERKLDKEGEIKKQNKRILGIRLFLFRLFLFLTTIIAIRNIINKTASFTFHLSVGIITSNTNTETNLLRESLILS